MPTLLQLLQSFVYLIPLLIRSTFLTRRKGRLFVEIPLTTSANSVSSTREGSAAGGRAGETVVLKKKKVNIDHGRGETLPEEGGEER